MPSFDFRGNHLKVTGVLDEDSEYPLRDNLRKLLACGTPTVEIDLTGVVSISSVCLGELVSLWVDLRATKRTMKLSVSSNVEKLLNMVGLTSVIMTNTG